MQIYKNTLIEIHLCEKLLIFFFDNAKKFRPISISNVCNLLRT